MTNAQPSIARQIDLNNKLLVIGWNCIPLLRRWSFVDNRTSLSEADVERDTTTHRNFWALLEFWISARDQLLQDHLAIAPANAKYTSPTIQNKVADIVGFQVKRQVLHKVREAQLYSLITDEVTDSSNKEQLA